MCNVFPQAQFVNRTQRAVDGPRAASTPRIYIVSDMQVMCENSEIDCNLLETAGGEIENELSGARAAGAYLRVKMSLEHSCA
jgi:hypothetical protein